MGVVFAITVALEVLLLELVSEVDELTVAVLTIFVLWATELLIVATIIAVADEPADRDEKLTVRVFPVPPHVPFAAPHETNVIWAGKSSVIETLLAVPPLLFVTVSK